MNCAIKRTGRLLAMAAVLVQAGAHAQVVRPVVTELRNQTKGWVEYYNDSMFPLNVFLEARSFTVSETGEILYRPLDPGVRLRFSAASFRIAPKETYYLSFEVTAEPPVWFVIYAAFSGLPALQNGVNTRIWLPHTVYLLPKQSLAKSQVEVQQVRFDSAKNEVYLDVANTGEYFGRVQETMISYRGHKQDGPGFPLYPHSHRIMEFPLEKLMQNDDVPITVVMKFSGFSIETVAGSSVQAANINH